MIVFSALTPLHRTLAALLLSLLACTPLARASSPEDEIKLCVAGNTMDVECMREHRLRFEKYVVEETGDYIAKSFVARQLLSYYDRKGVSTTAQSRAVRTKNAAFLDASAVGATVLKTHYHACKVGLGCEKGFYLDQEAARERTLAIKQFFQKLNSALYRGEIKYLEQKIRLDSGI